MGEPSHFVASLQGLGANLYRFERGEVLIDLTDAWRAFREPVKVWVRSDRFGDDEVERLISLLEPVPLIRSFCFSGTRVTRSGVKRIRTVWPLAGIEVFSPSGKFTFGARALRDDTGRFR